MNSGGVTNKIESGGSIVAAFHGSANQRLFDTKLITSVRSAEQFEALRQDFLHKADTSVIQLNLSDESSVVAAVREHSSERRSAFFRQ